ncbi:DUF262 domain-containing protein [Streptomyces goshikiensis]|uniref:DUF262 domain-containing protein n=1 Tax=Streptomyces goshikiensis TaxID=1942 RepID=UPI00368C1035
MTMTLQTSRPIEHVTHNPAQLEARGLVTDAQRGDLDLNPSYQRGAVWSVLQQRSLVYSWLSGRPTGVITLSDRDNPRWAAANGDIYTTGMPWRAVVDGKQRLLCASAWFTDELTVPASWFKPDLIAETRGTEDGPYVCFSGLTDAGQLKFGRLARLLVVTFKTAATEAEEAESFLLINGGGAPQGPRDMRRAQDAARQV